MSLSAILSHITRQPPSYGRKHHYSFGKTLGAGAFGVVCQAHNKDTNENVAVKVIVKSKLHSPEQLDSIMDEFKILEKLDHPHIVQLREWFESRDKLYMVTELCTGGELFDRIIDHGSFTERDAARMLHEIASAVQYLHERNIVHRDVKPENLLYKYKSDNDKAPLVLCDFGVAKSLMNNHEVILSGAGSLGYAAPEVFTKQGHSKPVDVWSLGVVLYTILSGVSPFQSETAEQFMKEVKPHYKPYFYPDYWKHVSSQAKDLVTKMLEFDPNKRLTIDEVLTHPWLVRIESNASVDLLPTIRPKLEARKHWRAAFERLQLTKMLERLQLDGHGESKQESSDAGSRFMQVVAAAQAQAKAEESVKEPVEE